MLNRLPSAVAALYKNISRHEEIGYLYFALA